MKILVSFILTAFFVCGYSQEKFDASTVKKFQKKLNAEFGNTKTSPLLATDLAHFKSLEFFPINKNFYTIAHFTRTADEKPFKMKTSTAREPEYVKYGELAFVIGGKSFKLNVYRNVELSKKEAYKDYLFLPFSDVTSGNESYIGGRYIDLKIPKNDSIVIDFNTAYNPYCAYSPKYSCPKVPLENDLDIAIKAGVKKFHD
jgi:uncharacterized protein (DUF1684 family)